MEIKIKPLHLVAVICVTALLLLCGFVLGGIVSRNHTPAENERKEVITSQIIVDKINEEAFVVSKTIFLDQKATINIDQGSAWSNFWWGQSIEAEALMRVDLGVDYSKLTENDISIDSVNKVISINLPEAEILDTSLSGEIQVISKSGVLKFLLANDPNQDFNLALQELTTQANSVVSQDSELFEAARTDSAKILQLALSDLGYKIEVN